MSIKKEKEGGGKGQKSPITEKEEKKEQGSLKGKTEVPSQPTQIKKIVQYDDFSYEKKKRPG